MNSTTLEIPSYFIVSQEQFELLAIANRDLRLERSPNGELIIMPRLAEQRVNVMLS
jgi:Uma2 family endonuclease